MDRVENDASNNSSIVAFVFVASLTSFENEWEIHVQTQTDERDL
jgi:hypothetical protein